MKTYIVTIYLNEPDDTIADRMFEAGLDDLLCCHGSNGHYIEAEVKATDIGKAITKIARKLIAFGFELVKVYAEEEAL